MPRLHVEKVMYSHVHCQTTVHVHCNKIKLHTVHVHCIKLLRVKGQLSPNGGQGQSVATGLLKGFILFSSFRYFETFDMVSDITSQDRIDLLQLTSKCSSPEALGKLLS